jgi:hypothetical protein
MYRLNRSYQSVSSYFFSGLPSFIASNLIEQAPVLGIIRQAPIPDVLLRAKRSVDMKLGAIPKVSLRPL